MRLPIVILSLALPLVLVSVVFGHAAAERFDPSPGAVLETAPSQVDAWFIQDVRRQEGASFIEVYDASGNQVDDGSPIVDDADRRHMSVGVNAGLGAGRYMVAWQSLSDEDDELDGGCHYFFVGQAAADLAHEQKLRINAPEECPIDLEGATSLYGKSEEPAASITLDLPAEVDGTEITVGMTTAGVTIRAPLGQGRDPKFAHYHIYLDTVPNFQHSHAGETEGGMSPGATMDPSAEPTPSYSRDIMAVDNTYTFKDLAPGVHVVTAALFYDDHSPFDPHVTQAATFRVLGDSGGAGTITVIIIAVVVGILAAIAGGIAGNRLLRRGSGKP